MDEKNRVPNEMAVVNTDSQSPCDLSKDEIDSADDPITINPKQYSGSVIKEEHATQTDGDTHGWPVKVETVTVEVEPYNIVENIGETSAAVNPLSNEETEGASDPEKNYGKKPNLRTVYERSVKGHIKKQFGDLQSPNLTIQDYIKKHNSNYPGTYMKDTSKKDNSTKAGTVSETDSIKVFKCEICEKTFKKRDHLKRHFITHSAEKPYKCDTCERTFTDKSNLKKHFRSHTGEMRFKCEICQRTFRDAGNLKIHNLTHTGEKPFQCHICPRNFTQSFSLVKHIRTHTGEKPFKCEICDTRFRNMCHLKRHTRIHTGEKPYKCVRCDRTFTRKYNLMAHQRSHDHSPDNRDIDRPRDMNADPLNIDPSHGLNAESYIKIESI